MFCFLNVRFWQLCETFDFCVYAIKKNCDSVIEKVMYDHSNFSFLRIGNWFIWCHHPSAGCPWSNGNPLQEHRDLSEKGKTVETFDFCSKQVWLDPYLGYCESSICWFLPLILTECVCASNLLSDCIIHSFFKIVNQKRWVAVLSPEYPTLAFHASLTNSFGKGSLIQLLRQFGKVSICRVFLSPSNLL